MASDTGVPSAASAIAHGFRSVARPPFATLTGIGLLLWGAARSVPVASSGGELASLGVLMIVSAYVQIAAIVAAADPDPHRSADRWLRAAVKRRCFWRFLLAELFSVALLLLGAVLFIVPSLFVGAAVALAAPAAVLERLLPGDAVSRSFRLTRGYRRTTGTVFGLLRWLPLALGQVGYGLRWDTDLGAAWVVLEGAMVIVGMAAVIALTHLYVALSAGEEDRGLLG